MLRSCSSVYLKNDSIPDCILSNISNDMLLGMQQKQINTFNKFYQSFDMVLDKDFVMKFCDYF